LTSLVAAFSAPFLQARLDAAAAEAGALGHQLSAAEETQRRLAAAARAEADALQRGAEAERAAAAARVGAAETQLHAQVLVPHQLAPT